MTASSENVTRHVDRVARVGGDVARWVGAGLLTEEQANAIMAFERSSAVPARPGTVSPDGTTGAILARPRPVSVVAEALGYLGGTLAVVGLVVLVLRYWPDMATAGRLVLAGAGAVASGVGGALVPERPDPALARLRGFLWLASSAATAVFAGVLAADGFDAAEEIVAAACGAAVAVYSGLLWRWRDRPVQQLTCLAGLALAIGLLAAWATTEGVDGIVMWAIGALYVAAGLRRRTPHPMLTEVVGAGALLFGTMIVMVAWQGTGALLGVATGFALLACATVPPLASARSDQILLGVSGGLMLAVTVPGTLGYFASDAGVATGLVTWAIGAALVGIGARRLVRVPIVAVALGAATLLGGAALTAAQAPGFAPLFGIGTAVGLVAVGMLPGQVLLSVLGSLGLLINVPWAIGYYFPGEGRAPLLIMVTGALIIGIAVLLSRMSGRIRDDLGGTKRRPPPPGSTTPHPAA